MRGDEDTSTSARSTSPKRTFTAISTRRRCPIPDLLIRTSGELRVSNFLLWQIAYTEIFVTERYWPDFRGIHLLEAIADFQRRERRYGGIGEAGGEVEEDPERIRIAVS